MKLKVQLNNATATLNDMEKELEDLNADIKGHVAEWKKLGTTLTDVGGKIKAVGSTLQSIGSTLTRYVTGPIVAVGTYSSKAAIDFESAFAGVRKTVDATEEQFAELEEGIRNPAIVHSVLCYPKIWSVKTEYQKWVTKCGERHNCSCQKYFDLWHSFAKK